MSLALEWGPNSLTAITANTLGICVFTLCSPLMAPCDLPSHLGNVFLVSAVALNLIKQVPSNLEIQNAVENVSLTFGALAIYCKLSATPLPSVVIALTGIALVILGQLLSTPFPELSARKIISLLS